MSKSKSVIASVAQAVQAGVQGSAQAAGAAPVHVALRGGQAVALVQVAPTAVYRTKAPHNVAWWATIVARATAQPAAVSVLCAQAPAGAGVPTHFVGYCLRRGYLVAVQPQA